jgi:hypothetical protein
MRERGAAQGDTPAQAERGRAAAAAAAAREQQRRQAGLAAERALPRHACHSARSDSGAAAGAAAAAAPQPAQQQGGRQHGSAELSSPRERSSTCTSTGASVRSESSALERRAEGPAPLNPIRRMVSAHCWILTTVPLLPLPPPPPPLEPPPPAPPLPPLACFVILLRASCRASSRKRTPRCSSTGPTRAGWRRSRRAAAEIAVARSGSEHAWEYLLHVLTQHTSSQQRREISVKSGFRSGNYDAEVVQRQQCGDGVLLGELGYVSGGRRRRDVLHGLGGVCHVRTRTQASPQSLCRARSLGSDHNNSRAPPPPRAPAKRQRAAPHPAATVTRAQHPAATVTHSAAPPRPRPCEDSE